MKKITFISTIHKELGKCNSDELLEIIKRIKPNVIFLEALDCTYSEYDKMMFNSFGIFHKKLEIQAIQKYSNISEFEYFPVLHSYLENSFEEKFNIANTNSNIQSFILKYNKKIELEGFDLLNSDEGIYLAEEQRRICDDELNNNEINKRFNIDINNYENSMLSNIYSYSKDNNFESAIFMCGVGHRKSIIDKIREYRKRKPNSIIWEIYSGKKCQTD